MIEVDLQWRRGGFELDATFASDRPITGLVGPSGAGKSSILDLIAGVTRADAGRVTLRGRTLFDRTARHDLPPHRRGLGVVFQENRLLPHLSVRRNIDYGARRRGERTSMPFDEVVERH